MNEMEQQLSRLFNAVIGEPPRPVSAHAVRRRAVRRRRLSYVTATAALAVAGSVGVALAATVTAPHHQVTAHPSAIGRPAYYYDSAALTKHGRVVNLVRSTATGAIAGSIKCPVQNSFYLPIPAAATTRAGQTFFISCAREISGVPARAHATRIYQFTVSDRGQVGDLKPVAGGNLPGLEVEALAATPSGSRLAVVAQPAKPGVLPWILVINPRTGQRVRWQANKLHDGVSFYPVDLSFARNGGELAAFGYTNCFVKGCEVPGDEMIAVRPASKGGSLAAGRVIFSVSPRAESPRQAFLSPDGRSAIVSFDGPQGGFVARLNAATGQQTQVVFRLSRGGIMVISPDSSGRFILIGGVKGDTASFNGWIDHGQLKPLKGGLAPTFEAW